MKARFALTPIAAAVFAFGSSAAFAATHDTTKKPAETYSAVPQITGDRPAPAVEQRSQAQREATTQGDRQRDITGQQQQRQDYRPLGAGRTPGTVRTEPAGGEGTMTGTVGGQERAAGTGAGVMGQQTTGQQMSGQTTSQAATAGRTGTSAQHWDRQHRASKIIGMDVQNRQGERIGKVEDIVLDARGNAAYAIVSTGGFLGVGDRLHAVPWQSMRRDTAGENLTVDVDRDRLRNAPGFDRNSWPNMTDQQWRQQNQRYWPQTAAGSAAGTTGMQQDQRSGATAQQTGKKPYGTDVDPDRMRQTDQRPGMTGQTGGATPSGGTTQQPGTAPGTHGSGEVGTGTAPGTRGTSK